MRCPSVLKQFHFFFFHDIYFAAHLLLLYNTTKFVDVIEMMILFGGLMPILSTIVVVVDGIDSYLVRNVYSDSGCSRLVSTHVDVLNVCYPFKNGGNYIRMTLGVPSAVNQIALVTDYYVDSSCSVFSTQSITQSTTIIQESKTCTFTQDSVNSGVFFWGNIYTSAILPSIPTNGVTATYVTLSLLNFKQSYHVVTDL